MALKKTLIVFVLYLTGCICTTPLPVAYAAEPPLGGDVTIAPCMEYILSSGCTLSINNSTAYINASVRSVSSTTKCQIILKLQQKTGSSWKTIQSWTDSKTGSYMTLSKTKTVTRGKTYRATATFTVWSGTKTESKTVYSAAKTA